MDHTAQGSSMNWRKLRRRLAIASLLGLVAFCVVTWFVGNSLIAPANHPIGPPPSDLNAVTTTLLSESGSQIATWYIPATDSKATIILLHPIHTSRLTMLDRARLFHKAGYAVVMIDFQAHGESPGDHITVGYLEQHDVRAAVDYARKTNPNHRIGIDGWSLGGASALLASPLGVDAIVLESAYPTVSEAVHDRIAIRLGRLSYVLSPALLAGLQLRYGIAPSDLRPIDHIAQVGCPVLVLAGDADRHTTLAETQRLYDAAGEPKKLIIFPGAAHDDFLTRDAKQYESEVLSFFATYLASPNP
jgi:alpha-beta hydrolase superfamily lysophospholipase